MNVLKVGTFKHPNGDIGPVLITAVGEPQSVFDSEMGFFPIDCLVVMEDGALGSELHLHKTWDNFIPLKAKIKVEIEWS